MVLLGTTFCASAFESGLEIAALYAQEVGRRLDLPEAERRFYAEALTAELQASGRAALERQFVVLVDRSPKVQAAMIFLGSPEGGFEFIGASPASTGKPGGFEYFRTPTGVFDHTIDNPDFRALGTKNELGIRGYGVAGMRVFDFGWVRAPKSWAPGYGLLRLQLHATDPVRLEPGLGVRRSKGCIRIPATLDSFMDRYGVLDADYERALLDGRHLWVLRPDRAPTPWSGRYLVVVDSRREARPDWASLHPPAGPGPGTSPAQGLPR
jgi:hypothetical protein